ncbi:helix-turn-helix domain-containing protein [Kribbella sandramycini]|uniref:Helix-turn-helix domain-containing protein n=1 Tax=Kribbella sandramycini TaxID=60450 RepID=A0A7Y4L6Z8_9ACTN|nr:helix-turn-helix domain-containing protein [Kribbella sandramycini]MBB6566690.1 putative DNA-binding transcriptional regulator AlpA [Kribbella sandramycini]NOL45478.1 helix-turn-helix domain-containing protein [Kribbella sandramycini]
MTGHPDDEPLWDADQVAAYLKVPKATLYTWRRTRYGPRGRRVGRHLRYRPSEVIGWFANLDVDDGNDV